MLLALLAEHPMHPYRMHEVIRARGKDRIANVAQRNSVYQTIDRLVRAGLIVVEDTRRDERRPERTVYALAPAGRDALREWTAGMLASPAPEYPEFPAALSVAMVLSPEDFRAAVEKRRDDLRAALAVDRVTLREVPGLPRLFLLDEEYLIAVREAELRWLDGLVDALESGEIDWDEEWIAEVARKFS